MIIRYAAAALLFLATVDAVAQDADRLHIILCADSISHDVQWSCRFDAYRMYEYLHYSVPDIRRGPEKVLLGQNLTRANLMTTIGQQPVGRNDTLLVYYSGHGSNSSQGHVLNLPNGDDAFRSDIEQAMLRKGARLNILLTDSCVTGSTAGAVAAAGVFDYSPPYWNLNICRYLFFRHTGFVNINSSSPGQASVCQYPGNGGQRMEDGGVLWDGGVFTTALTGILTLDDGELRERGMVDGYGCVTWASIRDYLTQQTDHRYNNVKQAMEGRGDRSLSRQNAQTPWYLASGTPVTEPLPSQTNYRIGMRYGQGNRAARVSSVYEDTNAAWAGLRPGDEILRMRRSDSHFWKSFAMGQGDDFTIRGVDDISQAMWQDINPDFRGLQTHVTKGLWILTVRRNGNVEEVPVRVPFPVNP